MATLHTLMEKHYDQMYSSATLSRRLPWTTSSLRCKAAISSSRWKQAKTSRILRGLESSKLRSPTDAQSTKPPAHRLLSGMETVLPKNNSPSPPSRSMRMWLGMLVLVPAPCACLLFGDSSSRCARLSCDVLWRKTGTSSILTRTLSFPFLLVDAGRYSLGDVHSGELFHAAL